MEFNKYFTNHENNHLFFRNIAYNYLLKSKNEYLINNNFVEYRGNVIDFEGYLDNVKKVGNYLGELEMSVITVILNISIYIFELNENNNSYKLVYKNIG